MTDQPDLDAIRTREQMREAIAASFEHGAMEMRERAALTMQHVLDTVAPVDQDAEAIRDLPIGTHRPEPRDEGLRANLGTAVPIPGLRVTPRCSDGHRYIDCCGATITATAAWVQVLRHALSDADSHADEGPETAALQGVLGLLSARSPGGTLDCDPGTGLPGAIAFYSTPRGGYEWWCDHHDDAHGSGYAERDDALADACTHAEAAHAQEPQR